MSKNTQYDQLNELSRRAQTLEGISRLLGWDQETYMPKDATPVRAEQLKLLTELSHEAKTGPVFEAQLKKLIDLKTGKIKASNLTQEQQAAVRLYARDFTREKKLPSQFVQDFVHHTSQAIVTWQKAKAANKFAMFLPSLKKTIDLTIEKTELIGYKTTAYDALIDEYEPGITTKEVDAIFEEVKAGVKPIIKRAPKPKKEIQIDCTLNEQLEMCHELLHDIGFDFNRGRLDVSSHPFSQSYHPYDSRITCRDESDSLIVQLLTTLHEAGHSFYEMGFPVKAFGTPLAQAVSMGIHESQSRFWETRIGRSRAFWKFFLPKLQKRFKKELKLDDFMSRLNQVQPSFIRTDSDEVTYPLHVILRYEIEKELVSGKLAVKDLPKRWNAGIKDLLGITVKTDVEGCLQDIHWSMGAFGYFPTYSLGNIYAAQMFEAFAKKHPTWEKQVEKGQFGFIQEWLHDNVWQHGRRYDGNDLIRKISGKALTAKPFINYLNEKYS
ncbi:MAG: carboxypeptidase M32 [Verrucomicrobia bacterium]|nr:carboxypeptidase M32 [Verrucomicrobiota bacterium]